MNNSYFRNNNGLVRMNRLSINTPQNVRFDYRLASVGSRMVAFAIDYAIIVCYFILIVTILSESNALKGLDQWAYMGVYSVVSLPAIFYPLITETFMEGQTVGKRVLKLKVVKVDGTRATFCEYFIRWISTTVDIFISMGAIGLSSMILSKRSQRIGDIAAETTVVSLKQDLALRKSLFSEITKEHQVTYPQVIKLSDQEINEVKEIYQLAYARKNYQIILALAERLQHVLGIQGEGRPEDLVAAVIQDHYYVFRDK